MWGRQIGEMAGVSCPLQAAEHYYIILDGVEGDAVASSPYWRIHRYYGYFREEGSGLMVGLFETVAAVPWSLDAIRGQVLPSAFSIRIVDRMMPYLQNALRDESLRPRMPPFASSSADPRASLRTSRR